MVGGQVKNDLYSFHQQYGANAGWGRSASTKVMRPGL